MFSKLSLVVLVAPLVSAFTLNTPMDVTSGGPVTLTWTTSQNDPPTVTFELINTVFNSQFAIANNIDSTLGTLTLTLPTVPVGDGYTIEAVQINDINDILSQTSSFSIGATISSSTSSTSSASTSSGTETSTSVTSESTASTTGTETGTSATASSTQTGTETSTGTGTVGTSAGTSAGTATSSGTTASATSFSAASRLAFTNTGGCVVLLLSVVAGGVAIAL